ncbi:MAG: MFS transporter, partial [Candidatus Latescibacteria bacterium]|nr:MFS transporter [Candidatus Latescibacterota bacterium]
MPETAPSSTSLKALFNRRYVAALVISYLFSVITAPLYSLVQVYVESELDRAPVFSGATYALFRVLGGVTAIPAGALCDTFGIRRMFIVGISGPLIASTVFLTGDPLLLGALFIVLGIAFGFSNTGGGSYLLNAVPASVLGMAAAGYLLGTTLGIATGNLFAGPIADSMGYQALGAIACVAAVCLLVGSILFLPDLPRRGEDARSESGSTVGYLTLLRRREIRLLLGFRLLPACYWGAASLLLPLLIFRISGTNTSATTYTAVSLTVAGAFQVVTGGLCDRIGRWRPILTATVCITVSAVGLTLVPNSLVGLYVFGTLAAASYWSLSAAGPGLLRLGAKEGEEGRGVGVSHLVWSAGML